MTERDNQEAPSLSTPRAAASPDNQFLSPCASPTGTGSFASEFSDDEDHDSQSARLRRLSAQERLLRSPTDKLLSPVSRALKTHRKPDPKRVRTSLVSLMDAM